MGIGLGSLMRPIARADEPNSRSPIFSFPYFYAWPMLKTGALRRHHFF